MKILVTGADGFIGSHLVEALVHRGHTVRAFVMYQPTGHRGWIEDLPKDIQDHLEIFSGDIRDPHGVHQSAQGVDAVAHLAALIGIPYSYHSPDTYIDTNVKGTLNVVQAARSLGLKRVVHTSTSEVYGSARWVPMTEEHPLCGQSPYSASKIAADQIAYSFYASFNVPVTIVRPFNTYGPRQSSRAVIPTVIAQLLSGVSELRLGAVHPTRDLSYVSDTVHGFVCALESSAGVGEVVQLGSHFEISVGDLAQEIATLMGRPCRIVSDAERQRPDKSEVVRLYASYEKARTLWNWSPEYGGLEGLRRGLARTIDWFAHPERMRGYDASRYYI